jgi:2-haloacid dehalogenase
MPSRNPTRVVFDFGKVLVHWDPRIVYQTIFETEAEMDHFLTRILPPEWNLEQDRGRSWKEAEDHQIRLFPAYASEIRAFRARWREMVPYPIGGTVHILEKLKAAQVPLYGITNFASDTLDEAKTIYPFLAHSFIDIVVSGDEKLIKPDAASSMTARRMSKLRRSWAFTPCISPRRRCSRRTCGRWDSRCDAARGSVPSPHWGEG